jgi:AraC-like ligand binding domain
MDEQTFRTRLNELGGATAYTVDWQPGHVTPEHAHDFDAHGLVIAGAFTLETPEGPRHVPAGQTFELKAGTPHREVVGARRRAADRGTLLPRSGDLIRLNRAAAAPHRPGICGRR